MADRREEAFAIVTSPDFLAGVWEKAERLAQAEASVTSEERIAAQQRHRELHLLAKRIVATEQFWVGVALKQAVLEQQDLVEAAYSSSTDSESSLDQQPAPRVDEAAPITAKHGVAVDSTKATPKDREPWARYYCDYADHLFRYVLSRVGNLHDAEDIVADAFVRAAGHLDRLEGNPAYLYSIARNLVNNRFSRARPETPSSELPELVRLRAQNQIELQHLQRYLLQTDPESEDGPEQAALLTKNQTDLQRLQTRQRETLEEDPERAALLAQDQAEVWQALEQLTADQREALQLRYFGELDSAQIAEVIGKTPRAVDMLVSRARRKLAHHVRLAQVERTDFPEQCWNVYVPQLSTHLDGKLKSPALEDTLAHLGGCQYCQTAYAEMQEAGRRLR
jgi:RNA polymerase sigma factor (sigma-70 family)